MNRSLAFSLLLITLAAVPARGDVLAGQVVDSNGVGVAGVNIDAFNAFSGDRVVVSNGGTDALGNFAATMPAGVYDVFFTPPAPPVTSHLVTMIEGVAVVGTNNIGQVPLDPGVSLSGRVIGPIGQPLLGVNLDVLVAGDQLTLPNDTTDAAGQFAVAVPMGELEIRFDTTPVSSGTFSSVAFELSPTGNTNLGDVPVENGHIVFATVRGPGNLPVQNVDIDVIDLATGQKLFTPGDNTDGNGFVDLVLPPGNFDVEFCPQFANGLVAETVGGVSVPATSNLGIVNLQSGFVLSGTVTSPVGAALFNVDTDVFFSSNQAPVTTCGDNSDASGNYAVIVPAGTLDVVFTPTSELPFSARTHFSVTVNSNTTLNCTLCDAPVNYCTAGTNSTGGQAVISWAGSVQIPANNFTLTVEGAVPNSAAVFFYGGNTSSVPFGGGTRCVSAGSFGVFRLSPPIFADATGFASRAVDFTTAPANGIPTAVPIYFQYWYRDNSGPGTFNLSDGLEVRFCL